MVAKDWLEVAQVAGTVFAGSGLILTACQMRRMRQTADLQALQKFSAVANEREAALAEAKNKSQDDRLHAFYEFLNFLELYACAYNNHLVIGRGSKAIIRHKLEDSYIELDAAPEWHPHIAAAVDRSKTFAELLKFVTRHQNEIKERGAERARLRGETA